MQISLYFARVVGGQVFLGRSGRNFRALTNVDHGELTRVDLSFWGIILIFLGGIYWHRNQRIWSGLTSIYFRFDCRNYNILSLSFDSVWSNNLSWFEGQIVLLIGGHFGVALATVYFLVRDDLTVVLGLYLYSLSLLNYWRIIRRFDQRVSPHWGFSLASTKYCVLLSWLVLCLLSMFYMHLLSMLMWLLIWKLILS